MVIKDAKAAGLRLMERTRRCPSSTCWCSGQAVPAAPPWRVIATRGRRTATRPAGRPRRDKLDEIGGEERHERGAHGARQSERRRPVGQPRETACEDHRQPRGHRHERREILPIEAALGEPAGDEGRERIADEEAGRSGPMSRAAPCGSAARPRRRAGRRARGTGRAPGGRAEAGAERGAAEQHDHRLQRERHRRERQRDADLRAQRGQHGDEQHGARAEDSVAFERRRDGRPRRQPRRAGRSPAPFLVGQERSDQRGSEPVDIAADSTMRRALTIAGSDSGGGAGIQADLKTFAAYGVYGASAVTAITVQNTVAVSEVHLCRPRSSGAQIDAVLGDIGADAVKTGMLGNVDIVRAVADALRAHRPPFTVVDPVMIAKSGNTLLDADGGAAMRETSSPSPICDPERARSGGADRPRGALAGHRARGRAALARARPEGGAGQGRSPPRRRSGRRPLTTASRCVSCAARGSPAATPTARAARWPRQSPPAWRAAPELEAAILDARAYVAGAIAHAPRLGKGHGPLDHGWRARPDAAAR